MCWDSHLKRLALYHSLKDFLGQIKSCYIALTLSQYVGLILNDVIRLLVVEIVLHSRFLWCHTHQTMSEGQFVKATYPSHPDKDHYSLSFTRWHWIRDIFEESMSHINWRIKNKEFVQKTPSLQLNWTQVHWRAILQSHNSSSELAVPGNKDSFHCINYLDTLHYHLIDIYWPKIRVGKQNSIKITFSSFPVFFLSFGLRFLKNLQTHQPHSPMTAQTRTEWAEKNKLC